MSAGMDKDTDPERDSIGAIGRLRLRILAGAGQTTVSELAREGV